MHKQLEYLILLDVEIYNDDPDFQRTWKSEMALKQNFDAIDISLYERLDRCYYLPTDSMELFDYENDTWYSGSGTILNPL
jgi:hypothetical protein